MPEWLGTALVGAAFAALGYVGKTIVESWRGAQDERRARRAALVELHSLLRAGRVTFEIQNAHARALLSMVRENHPERAPAGAGFEETFASAYDVFTDDERELHRLIRSMTVNAIRPTNEALSEWLERDTFYKAHPPGHRGYGRLAQLLARLEAHLILWHAKYPAWIPDHPEHALVYLADEQRHGLGFPGEIEDEVARVLGLRAEEDEPPPTG